jgi:teichuronic acid biosynthesis glycosyltransferase TuaH
MPLDFIFICPSEKWWDWERYGFVSRAACVARALAENEGVRNLLVVDNPSSILRSVAVRFGGIRRHSGLTTIREGVHVLDHVRLLPRERHSPWAFRANRGLHDRGLQRRIARAQAVLGMQDPVVWLACPHVAPYAWWFGDSIVVYDAMDEWLADGAETAMRPFIHAGYLSVAQRADIVFTASKSLARTFDGAASVVRHVANGVDPARFRRETRQPDALAGIPHPRVGYVGTLQDRIDVAIVSEVATLMADAQFVFVGPVLDSRHFASISSFPNVHFVGPCPHDQVPDYLAAFDVCIMPHVLSEFTRNMDPLKLYEYVAAGRLVVASDLPGLEQPHELVRRARTAEEFVVSLRDALEGRWGLDQDLKDRYIGQVRWANRVDAIVETVSLFANGGGARSARRY